jgi:nitrogen fixation-related uncharacterized protein
MGLIYILIWGAVLLFGATAVWGLVWAIRNGQIGDFARGATSIFDDEEPVGSMTDAFPETPEDPPTPPPDPPATGEPR